MKAPRRLVVTGAPAALAGLVFLSTGASARADDGGATHPGTAAGAVGMSAQAVAIQTVYRSLNVPFGLPLAVGSYGASATVDAGGSTSDAGAPYSPLVSSLPNTGNGVASTMGYSLPVVPTLPGYVSAQYPDRAIAAQQAGIYDLTASARPTEAEGQVSIGGQHSISDKNNLFALAHTVSKDDATNVNAQAGAVALSLPGILDLANTSSQILVAQGKGDARPIFTSTTSLGTITVVGTTTGVTGSGSQVAGGKSTPINLDTLSAINQALAASGVSLTYVPQSFIYTDGTFSSGQDPEASKTVRGVTSGALQILYQKDIQGQGPTSETITVGQVSVTADAVTDTPSAASGQVDASSIAPAAAIPMTPAPGSAPSNGASAGPALAAPKSTTPLPSNTVALVESAAPLQAPSTDRIRAEVARMERLNFSVDDTYLIVVVVGAAMLAGSVVSRLRGSGF
jgi:hypothetical protein